jgi:CBS domain-containing protein
MRAVVGDRIVVRSGSVDRPDRQGTVREVLGSGDDEHYRVSWDDGHESLLYPGPDAVVIPAQSRREQPPATSSTTGSAAEGTRGGAQAGVAPPAISRTTPDDPVERIMSSPVATAEAHDSLRMVAVSLADAAVGALVVMDDDTPLGMISERDIVHAVADGIDPDQVEAVNMVGATTVWAQPTDSIREVAAMMREAEVRHIPVRVQDDVVGVVSIRDVVQVLMENC